MNIVINTSALSATGVTQVSTSFIYECMGFPSNTYHVFLSKTVSKQINKSLFTPNFVFYDIEYHPLYGFMGFIMRCKMRELLRKISPDVVFSVFGPSWWSPKFPHLQGYAYPHYVYKDSPVFGKMNFFDKIRVRIFEKIHLYFLKRNGHYFVCETKDVSARFINLIKNHCSMVYTVGNTANHYFFNFDGSLSHSILPPKNKCFRFVTLAAPLKHKNIEVIAQVIPLLIAEGIDNFQFVLTVDEKYFKKYFSGINSRYILNLGRIPVASCPQVLSECDAVFLPTLLECYSASYPEAMVLKKPILTSDLSFAKSVCGEAAIYYDPINPDDIVEKIILLMSDECLYDTLISRGLEQLKLQETPKSRAEKYLSICEDIYKNEK